VGAGPFQSSFGPAWTGAVADDASQHLKARSLHHTLGATAPGSTAPSTSPSDHPVHGLTHPAGRDPRARHASRGAPAAAQYCGFANRVPLGERASDFV